jgi:GNAT superfamily N-acetyltransferase
VLSARWPLRLARESDVPVLEALIPVSARALQAADYSPAQLDAALGGDIYGVDRQLIEDGTYYVVEEDGRIVGCGGWSKRRSRYGGSKTRGDPDPELDPAVDAARMRAFYVHPDYARRGIGASIVRACEEALAARGFGAVEIMATLTGARLYAAMGYAEVGRVDVPMAGGLVLPCVRMAKRIEP